jgi:hypothetical protein
MKLRIYLVTTCLLVFLMPGELFALTRAKLTRVHLDTTLFRAGIGEHDYDDGAEVDHNGFTGGFGMSSAGIGAGFAVIDGLVVGGKLTLGAEGYDPYHVDGTGFAWSIMPYVEYIFLDGLARPFVMGTLGFEGRNDMPDDDDYWWWAFAFGMGGGVHLFVFDNLSFDIGLLVGFDFGTGENENFPVGKPTVTDDDFDHWMFKLEILLGISGWI